MIKGTTKNINISVGANKNSPDIEAIVPQSVDRRNGKMTEAGNWLRRPGYVGKWSTGSTFPVNLLIPEFGGFATTGDGKAWRLTDTPAEIKGAVLTGPYRPTYTAYQPTAGANESLIICNGGVNVKITTSPVAIAALGGTTIKARFVDTIDTRVILCGHDAVSFIWSDLEKAESYPAENFNAVKGDGERIVYFKIENRLLYFFKSKSIEIWASIGRSPYFARQHFIEVGCGASYSPVFANNQWYWFGGDGEFYKMSGASPQVISSRYRTEIDKAANKGEMYGFHFAKERLIRWFVPGAAKCLVYDYVTDIFSEDNAWDDGQWLRLPINAYMEKDGEQYIGDLNSTGKIYHWSKDHKDDNGAPIRVYRKFAIPVTDSGGEGRANKLSLRVDRGNGSADVPSPNALVRWHLDRGEWLSEQVDLGAVGEHYPYVDIASLGIGRELEFEMIESDAVDSLITHAYLTVEPLGV